MNRKDKSRLYRTYVVMCGCGHIDDVPFWVPVDFDAQDWAFKVLVRNWENSPVTECFRCEEARNAKR